MHELAKRRDQITTLARLSVIIYKVRIAFDTGILHKEAKTLTKAGYEVVLITWRDNRA